MIPGASGAGNCAISWRPHCRDLRRNRCLRHSESVPRASTLWKAENQDFRRNDLRGPKDRCEADGHGHFLCAAGGIADDAAADGAAEIAAPQPPPRSGIEGIEVAAHITEENHASGGRGYPALNGVVR